LSRKYMYVCHVHQINIELNARAALMASETSPVSASVAAAADPTFESQNCGIIPFRVPRKVEFACSDAE
jgi:hypothetical protein